METAEENTNTRAKKKVKVPGMFSPKPILPTQQYLVIMIFWREVILILFSYIFFAAHRFTGAHLSRCKVHGSAWSYRCFQSANGAHQQQQKTM